MTDTAVAKVEEGRATGLVLRADQDRFDEMQLAALRSLGIDDAPEADVDLFFHQAKRTQLDPFSRQIYLIGRWDSTAGRKKYSIQTSIDGFRIYRDRIGGFAGQREQWCGPDGVWRDVWLGGSGQYPAAARVLVWKEGWTEPVQGIALWSEFAPYKNGKPQALWAKMPALMLAKCAEALALRKAFPHDLSGLYVAEEMAQAEDGVTTLVATPSAGGASESSQAAASSPSSPGAGQAAAPTAPTSPSPAGEPPRAQPDPDMVARARQAVLSVTWKGAQQGTDDGLRSMFRRVGKQGLLEVEFAPGDGTFREVMTRLARSLPAERPSDEVVDAEVVDDGPPTEPDAWSVPPEGQQL